MGITTAILEDIIEVVYTTETYDDYIVNGHLGCTFAQASLLKERFDMKIQDAKKALNWGTVRKNDLSLEKCRFRIYNDQSDMFNDFVAALEKVHYENNYQLSIYDRYQ